MTRIVPLAAEEVGVEVGHRFSASTSSLGRKGTKPERETRKGDKQLSTYRGGDVQRGSTEGEEEEDATELQAVAAGAGAEPLILLLLL